MCRQAAFPPGFPRKEALRILEDFEALNTDGVGCVYLKDNEFVVNKYPTSFTKIMKRGIRFLGHMPYDGWTIAHLRAASHGENTVHNTHPFVVGSWAISHNGIWSDHAIVRLAMSRWVKMVGETDSIVAAHLINTVGPKRFTFGVESGGVFLALNKDRTLWVLKTSGCMEGKVLDNKTTLLASEFPDDYEKNFDIPDGWVRFEKDGKYLSHNYSDSKEPDKWPPDCNYSYGGTSTLSKLSTGVLTGFGTGTVVRSKLPWFYHHGHGE